MNTINMAAFRPAEQLIEAIRHQYKAVGMAVSLFKKDGTVLYEGFFGSRNEALGLPVDENTLFGLASCTKSFTCLAIFRLMEQGLLSEEDELGRHIPEFSGKNQPGLRLKHLMSHSGGFFPLERMMIEPLYRDMNWKEDEDPAYSQRLAQEGARRVALRLDAQTREEGLIGPPGLYYSYCNDGYGLLSHIVSGLSGRPFASYLKEEVMMPLGMSRSSCEFNAPARDENVSLLYRYKEGKQVVDLNFRDRAFVLHGGGAAKSTLKDMRRYLQMYMNGGSLESERIISREGLLRMLLPRINTRPGSAYACGFGVSSMGNATVYSHGGSLPGVSSHMSWSPELEAGALVLCNTSDVPVAPITEALLRTAAGISPLWERPLYRPQSWDEAFIREALGSYRSGEGTHIVLSRDDTGALVAQTGGGERSLIPVNANTLIAPGAFVDSRYTLHQKEGRIFALFDGSRMLPKEPAGGSV